MSYSALSGNNKNYLKIGIIRYHVLKIVFSYIIHFISIIKWNEHNCFLSVVRYIKYKYNNLLDGYLSLNLSVICSHKLNYFFEMYCNFSWLNLSYIKNIQNYLWCLSKTKFPALYLFNNLIEFGFVVFRRRQLIFNFTGNFHLWNIILPLYKMTTYVVQQRKSKTNRDSNIHYVLRLRLLRVLRPTIVVCHGRLMYILWTCRVSPYLQYLQYARDWFPPHNIIIPRLVTEIGNISILKLAHKTNNITIKVIPCIDFSFRYYNNMYCLGHRYRYTRRMFNNIFILTHTHTSHMYNVCISLGFDVDVWPWYLSVIRILQYLYMSKYII